MDTHSSDPFKNYMMSNKLSLYNLSTPEQLESSSTFLWICSLGWVGQTEKEWYAVRSEPPWPGNTCSLSPDEMLESFYEQRKFPTPGEFDKILDDMIAHYPSILDMDILKARKGKKNTPKGKKNTPEYKLRERIKRWFKMKRSGKEYRLVINALNKKKAPVENLISWLGKNDLNYTDRRDAFGNTALHYIAAYNVDIKAAYVLMKRLSHKERDITNDMGLTALDAAYARKNINNNGDQIRIFFEGNGMHRGEERPIYPHPLKRGESWTIKF
jgi:hypothetical protein